MADLNKFLDDYILLHPKNTVKGIHASEIRARLNNELGKFQGVYLIEINEEIERLKDEIHSFGAELEDYKHAVKRTNAKKARDLDDEAISKLHGQIERLEENHLEGLAELLGNDAEREDEELSFDLHSLSQEKLKELRRYVWKCQRTHDFDQEEEQ
jgi:vacuolar-type H+-ATPase subunit I/STV1